MKNELMELMKKKGKSNMDPMEHKARGNMLGALKGAMDKELGEDVRGLKKVTVAAPSAEGLAEGLDTAEAMVGDSESSEEGSEGTEAMGMEMPEPESAEECDAMIKHLEMKKMMLEKGE